MNFSSSGDRVEFFVGVKWENENKVEKREKHNLQRNSMARMEQQRSIQCLKMPGPQNRWPLAMITGASGTGLLSTFENDYPYSHWFPCRV